MEGREGTLKQDGAREGGPHLTLPRKHGLVPFFRLSVGRHRIELGRGHLPGSVGGVCDS